MQAFYFDKLFSSPFGGCADDEDDDDDGCDDNVC